MEGRANNVSRGDEIRMAHSTDTSTTDFEDEGLEPLVDNESQESVSMHSSEFSDEYRPIEGEIEEIWDVTHTMSLTKALYMAVYNNDWEEAKYFLELDRRLLTAKISAYGYTALEIAALAGHAKIVEELVHMTDKDQLAGPNVHGETALSLAAIGGITEVAKPLVRKNPELLSIENLYGLIPVVVAAQFGHANMVRFLYSVTDEEVLESGEHGARLLTACIIAQIYDIALKIVDKFPDLAFAELKESPGAPGGTLITLATRHSAFPSGTHLTFRQNLIYKWMPPINTNHINNIHRDIEANPEKPLMQGNIIKRGTVRLYGLMWDRLKSLVPFVKTVYDIKHKHAEVCQLLRCISEKATVLYRKRIEEHELSRAIFLAIKHGVVEFVEEFLRAYPDIVLATDSDSRNIFLYAVLQREERIFNLLHTVGPRKNIIATSLDNKKNTILHHAAMLSPSHHLDGISGSALKMQRELQWFKEVEKVVKPMYRELTNEENKTARVLFTEQHKKMRKEGEKWMKDTATSCTVVATLIATVMFTAAFTVPGGYDQDTGAPIYLDHDSFMTFIISDALSLFSSASSVLMFLGILKSRYTEDQFLLPLPRKLIIGIATLFFSVVTMMLTFGAAIFLILNGRLSWISIPIVLLCCIPVMIFLFPQVPLLYEICVSTYGRGIFRKGK